MRHRAAEWSVSLPPHNLGEPLPSGDEPVLSRETARFDGLAFRRWRPDVRGEGAREDSGDEAGGNAGVRTPPARPLSSLWRTAFPVRSLLRRDGTLLPDAFNALRVEVDGRACRFGRYLNPDIHEPGKWGFRDGDLLLTLPVGERPRSVTITAEQTRAWHGRWAYSLWPGDDLDFVRRTVEIDGDRRQAVYLPAPGSITDHLVIPPGSRFEAAVGIRPVPALDPGDGVRFLGTFTESATGKVHPLFDLVVDPRTAEGRTWVDVAVDLDALGGKEGLLTLRTLPRASSTFDLAVVAHPRVVPVKAVPGTPWNLLLVVIDTLRADHLSVAGGPVSTPNLDALARNGWWFPDALSTSCWTGPSMASLFTGQYPALFGDGNFMVNAPPGFEEVSGLFDTLERHGWVTWGIQTNPVLKGKGWRRGLEACRFVNDALAEEVTSEAIGWLSRRGGEPFAAYVHYMDPHLPYRYHSPWCGGRHGALCPETGEPPGDPDLEALAAGLEAALQGHDAGGDELANRRADREATARQADTPGKRQQVRRLYRGEVRYVDYQVGRLLAELRRTGQRDHTVVAVVSDHGEELWEHGGFEHGHSFHKEVSRVVLLLDAPGRKREEGESEKEENGEGAHGSTGAGEGENPGSGERVRHSRGRVAGPVSLIDVKPTLLRLLGLTVETAGPGRDLLEADAPGRMLFGENVLYGPPQHAVYDGNWVLIAGEDGSVQLFDRGSDPEERLDVARAHPDRVARMRAAFARHVEACVRARPGGSRGTASSGSGDLDPETREQLRALGYVE